MTLRQTRSSRRDFFCQSGCGIGALALASLLQSDGFPITRATPSSGPLSPRPPHFAPKARRIIHLFMHGGPSHVDLFDPKPALEKYSGQPLPESAGAVMTRRKVARNGLLSAVRPFRRRGECGTEVSDFLPHLARHVDKLAVVRSCHGDSVNHPQSVYQMNTGSILMGRPSVGSWVAFGLGSENQDMPGYVVIPDPGGAPKGGPPAWGSGFLPSTFQGTLLRPGENPITNLNRSESLTDDDQRQLLDFIQHANHRHLEVRDFDDELQARINNYELAFRMQSAAPELVDLSRETEYTKRLYGIEDKVTRDFGTRCLLARRMVQYGVRFVQLYSGDTNGWDAHKNVAKNHGEYCLRTDRPIAGLLQDLEARGLLDDTLVIWGGEFGRMPMSEQGTGRDHNPWGYTVWLAGAGIRGGTVYGATDEFGLRAQENKVHIHDLHATILHLLGLDHEALTFFHNGRDQRLTDVAGHVVRGILA